MIQKVAAVRHGRGCGGTLPSRFSRALAFIALAATAVACAACSRSSSSLAPSASGQAPGAFPAPVPVPTAGAPDTVIAGAGDIARCGSEGAEATAKLLDRMPGFVYLLGDNAYPGGTAEQYANCFGPTWGRHRSRTYPTPGNHDWDAGTGAPYFAYFGVAAGPAGMGYYSVDLGGWHILSLNSNVAAQAGSPQYEWARSDVSRNSSVCTLAMWHHPRFSSGRHGDNTQMNDIWRLLQSSAAEVVLSGHDHHYERFAPQNADGRADPQGLRQFVAGTGGAELRAPLRVAANSEVRDGATNGVLKLTLHASSYDWEFVPVDGQSFRDFGSGSCR